MKNIGLILKEAREDKQLTLQDISSKTKITVSRLQAIEDGNIAYFDNDISYLKYYIKLYCQAVNVDFESIKDRIQDALVDYDDFTKTNIILEKQQLEQNINDRLEKAKPEKRKIDIPLLTMGIAIVVLVLILGFVIKKYALQDGKLSFDFLKKDKEAEVIDPYIENTPQDEPEVLPEVDVKTVVLDIKKSEKDLRYYTVTGWDKDTPVYIKFVCNEEATYLRFSVDGVDINNPSKGTYKKGDVFELVYYPTQNGLVDLNFGVYKTNELYVNDELIEISTQSDRNRHIFFEFN